LQNISWYLNFHINDVKTLFSDMILPYEVDCYICLCGNKEIIIKNAMDSLIKFVCPICENSSFINANDYNNNYIWYEKIEDLLPSDFLLSLEPNVKLNEKDKILSCSIDLDIPILVDLCSEQITFNKKSIYELNTNSSNEFENKLNANFDLYSDTSDYDIYFKNITENDLISKNIYLSDYQRKILKKLQIQAVSKVLKRTQSIDQFEFFLKNDKLLEIDFYYWKEIDLLANENTLTILDALDYIGNYRNEKTLKKAIFQNYKTQMREKKSYSFIYIYSITRYIKDINILNRMIDINLKEHIEFMDNSYYLFKFIEFLSSKFTDKQIEKLFLSYEKNLPFWLVDSVALFSEIIDYLDDFQISKCKYDVLHDDIVKYHQIVLEKELFNTKFKYDEKFLDACVNIEDYQVKLPLTGIELYDWSNTLQNCLSGYWKLIKEKKTIVYGFYKDDEIKFAVEIKNNKIVQSKSKYNKDLESRKLNLVLGWFKENITQKRRT
jgi:hypothetical protein